MAEKVRAVIICGSPAADAEYIKSFITEDDFTVCADSGLKFAKKAGIKPDLIVGDFDSFSGDLPEDIEIVRLNTHKDDTDSMHCAELCVKRGYKEIVFLGATGGRLDHSFANFCMLQYLSEKGVNASLAGKSEIVRVLTTGTYNFRFQKGKTFSVFPFGCGEISVSYKGEVEYPAENLTITSPIAVGISNIFNSDNIDIIIEKGTAIIFIETLV